MSDERWIVERYAHGEWSDYRKWMPVEAATYYATAEEALAALDALASAEYERSRAVWERDVQDCADRKAVYEKAAAAVEGMPQANIIARNYRFEPLSEPSREQVDPRVARVTTFQERVQRLLEASRGDSVDVDDLRECFQESSEPSPVPSGQSEGKDSNG